MRIANDSLWPDVIENQSIPGPVEILRRQGDILSQVTGGRLYADVVQSLIRSADNAVYDFYVCVTDKSFRHKLLTVECNIVSEYPAKLTNHLAAGAVVQVHSEEDYLKQLQIILGSTATTDLLGRLLSLAQD